MAYKVTAKCNLTMPVIAARGTVVFPKSFQHLDISRPKTIAAIRKAMDGNRKIFVVAQRNIMIEDPSENDLYTVGTVVELKQFVKRSETEYRIMVRGDYKAQLISLTSTIPYLEAEIKRIPNKRQHATEVELEAAIRAVKQAFQAYLIIGQKISRDLILSVETEQDPNSLLSLLTTHIPMKYEARQAMLEEPNVLERLHLLVNALTEEAAVLSLEKEIFEKVQDNIDQNQREYFLREQMRVIHEELGTGPDVDEEEQANYIEKIQAIQHISEDAKAKLISEAKRLEKMPPGSHETYVITNYLDTCLELPWDNFTVDSVDVKAAKKQLDKDHYGLEKVKERILENLAVRQFAPDLKGQIICLVGPPGVGKTSIASSVAKAMNRRFVRIALGGISDESDIRGHRKTYVGAMPGRIIAGIKQSKSRNPLVLLDEIDKMGSSFKGDPSSAMLEVLDGEQNATFVDHYIEVPFDLSECLFITTANSLSTIPVPLLDRMEVIELSSYTMEEKFHICKEHLIPKQRKKHGMDAKTIRFTDDAIYSMIDHYTREAGVRKLERLVASLCRKTAKIIAEGEAKSVRFTAKNLEKYLGPKKYLGDKIPDTDPIGLVNGLAWTSVGGELLQIEAGIMDGKGIVQLTGSLGDVMKESANTAISFVRSIAAKYGIPTDFYQKKDIHIHLPEGAVPKDGPSAGVALATVLVSALAGIPIRRDVAMTGEITLRGRDLPIGGLKEKAIAAYKSGVKTVLIPYDNQPDLEEVDQAVKDALTFIPCKTAEEVLEYALVQPRTDQKPQKKRRKGSLSEKNGSVTYEI